MKELFTALSKAQGSLKKAMKDSTNPHFKSRYADLESVIDAMREPFAENGLAVLQSVRDTYLETTITHLSGESITTSVPFVVTKNDMQGVGSAITYARRYGLAAACGITQTDDDAEAAVGRPVPAKPVQKTIEAVQRAPEKTVYGDDVPFKYEIHRGLVPEAARQLGIDNDYLKENKENLIKFLNDYATATTDSVKLALTSYIGAKQ
jgi:hypothetical protein